MDIPVFVINLKRSAERRYHTTKQLNDLDIPFQIIEAIDGTELSDQEIRNNPNYGIYKKGLYSRYLLKEEIGCALSHFKVYNHMVAEKIELACILEDDNDFSRDFKELLFNDHLNIKEWDLLYLGHHSGSVTKGAEIRKKKQVTPYNFWIGEAVEVPYGSYAYVINLNGAKKILNGAFPLRTPFDRYIGNYLTTGIRTFLLSPPCVSQNSSFSSTINNNPKIIYAGPFWKFIGVFKRKIYFWFPAFRTLRAWIYLKWNSISRNLRKPSKSKTSKPKSNQL
jgi:glycosyl transferase, family 25